MIASDTPLFKRDLLLLVGLFIFEASFTVIAIALLMKGRRPFQVFLTTRPGLAFLWAVVAFLVGGTLIIIQYRANSRSPSRHFRLVVAMNLLTVMLVVITGELALRAGVRSKFGFEFVGTTMLKPKSWETIRRHLRQVVNRSEGDHAFHTYDELLGWRLGPNRNSADSKYWASTEGLRAPHEGISFRKSVQQTDIALVGDSFTFGYEVTYEETYGYYLEQMLGSQFRILNFGVSGYGIDQAFLRYERDVRPWKPKIVVFGFISNDAERTMWVYPFASGIGWWDYPFSKPRLILYGEERVNLNVPTLSPEAILSRKSISELPGIEYQRGYSPNDWQERFYHYSYLIRLLESYSSPPSPVSPEVSRETLLSINASILKTFLRSAEKEQSVPLVIFFPSDHELEKPKTTLPLGKQVLEKAGIEYIDPTSCLLEVPPADRFMPQHHYTPQGNAAIAKCLLPAVHQALRQTSVRN
ncbi:MAG: hypothetical protein KF876_05305 [Nitrospira sp.]|nr:hypothetical protein [Nitrospira sp.]